MVCFKGPSQDSGQKSAISGQIWRDVKKAPNGRIQGSVPGEIDFGDFPFRLLKSRK